MQVKIWFQKNQIFENTSLRINRLLTGTWRESSWGEEGSVRYGKDFILQQSNFTQWKKSTQQTSTKPTRQKYGSGIIFLRMGVSSPSFKSTEGRINY